MAQQDQLKPKLPKPNKGGAATALSELSLWAMEASAITGDPGIELSVYGCAPAAACSECVEYVVQLNNRGGRQQSIGITTGRLKLRWPPNSIISSEKLRYYLQQICDNANALLTDLPTSHRCA